MLYNFTSSETITYNSNGVRCNVIYNTVITSCYKMIIDYMNIMANSVVPSRSRELHASHFNDLNVDLCNPLLNTSSVPHVNTDNTQNTQNS